MSSTGITPTPIAAPPSQAMTVGDPDMLDEVKRIKRQVDAVHALMKTVMKQGEHYGVIPGTEKRDPNTGADISKPTLYQPGADLLIMLFGLRPVYRTMRSVETDELISMTIRCRLVNRKTDEVICEGIGTCNSRETKYSSQTNTKKCPKCDAATIFASRDGGWFCWRKKGGCGAEFKQDDPEVTNQASVPVKEAIWNLHNTITKMANKRAKAAAVLTATGASEIFTADPEDDVPDDDAIMTRTQWNQIQNQQTRLGIKGNEFHKRFMVDLLGKEKISDLSFSDAVTILKELEKVPTSSATKPKDLNEAAARSKEKREGAAAAKASTGGGEAAGDMPDHMKTAEERQGTQAAASTPKPCTVQQRNTIATLAASKGVNPGEVAEKYNVESTRALTFADAEAALAWLGGMPDAEPGAGG